MRPVAATACVLLVLYLFWRERRDEPRQPWAVWIVFLWMFFAGTRYLSAWLNGGVPTGGGGDAGSPVDAMAFGSLIAAALVVLARRRLPWGRLAWANVFIVAYFAYCLASLAWSDIGSIAFKRWIKDLGNPLMALVLLTMPRPMQALGAVVRRFAYIALPVSVLFVKWFPEFGRAYHMGRPMFIGIGTQKNSLGEISLIVGLFLVWQMVVDRDRYRTFPAERRARLWLLAVMLGYLLLMSDSQTSLVCLLAGSAVMVASRLPMVRLRPGRLLALVVAVVLAAAMLEAGFDLYEQVLRMLGRDPGLTSRTTIWAVLLSAGTPPWTGTGFQTFWSGERLEQMQRLVGTIGQAHNGYIETYLNLGWIGLAVLLPVVVAGALTATVAEPRLGIWRIAFIAVALMFNYTEAAFGGIHNMWFLLLFAVMQPPRQRRGAGWPASMPARTDAAAAWNGAPAIAPPAGGGWR